MKPISATHVDSEGLAQPSRQIPAAITATSSSTTQIVFSHSLGRVEMWRSGCRLNISFSAPFVWRCLSGSALTPFPHPAHRTGHADFPHPACMGLSLSRGHHAIFVVLCHSILLFDPRRERSSVPTAYFHRRRAQRRSRTAHLQRRRRLVLDGGEHGGRLAGDRVVVVLTAAVVVA